MLTPSITQPARWVCWATAASLLVVLVQCTFAKSGRRDSRAIPTTSRATATSRELESRAPAASPPVAHRQATHAASRGAESRDPRQLTGLGAETSVLFVAGPNRNVRFRIDLRDGTLATPRAQRLLDRVIDVALSDRIVLLCQAALGARTTPRVIGFDLHTGERTEAALALAGTASVDSSFCMGRRLQAAHTRKSWAMDVSRYSAALQISLERQATILPSVSNGDLQSSFLISSRHSLSSLTTMPPGQS